MKITDDLFLLQRLDHLFRTRATGRPEALASRLEMCERNVYQLISDLKNEGWPIAYDKRAGTYYYTRAVRLDIQISVDGEPLISIHGGER